MAKEKIRAGIVGASGYAGGELVRLLSSHPGVEIVRLAGESSAGASLGEIFPHLTTSLVLEKISALDVWEDVDVVFLALPAGQSFDLARRFMEKEILVLDLGPDYRLASPALYREIYKIEHGFPRGIDRAVYGLVEWAREPLKRARLVACPGCFPTGALMGLLPFHKDGWIDPDQIIVDGKSGVTGSGRGLTLATHFPEISEGFLAYKVMEHRHAPEMEQALGAFSPAQVTFVPHLLPVNRGLMTTLYLSLREPRTQDEVDRQIDRYYGSEPFVRRVGLPPNLLHVRGTNNVLLHARVKGSRLVVLTAIDNLVKGAAGQAVQAMNHIVGFEETAGLSRQALFP